MIVPLLSCPLSHVLLELLLWRCARLLAPRQSRLPHRCEQANF
jgi:hypothetical protein